MTRTLLFTLLFTLAAAFAPAALHAQGGPAAYAASAPAAFLDVAVDALVAELAAAKSLAKPPASWLKPQLDRAKGIERFTFVAGGEKGLDYVATVRASGGLAAAKAFFAGSPYQLAEISLEGRAGLVLHSGTAESFLIKADEPGVFLLGEAEPLKRAFAAAKGKAAPKFPMPEFIAGAGKALVTVTLDLTPALLALFPGADAQSLARAGVALESRALRADLEAKTPEAAKALGALLDGTLKGIVAGKLEGQAVPVPPAIAALAGTLKVEVKGAHVLVAAPLAESPFDVVEKFLTAAAAAEPPAPPAPPAPTTPTTPPAAPETK